MAASTRGRPGIWRGGSVGARPATAGGGEDEESNPGTAPSLPDPRAAMPGRSELKTMGESCCFCWFASTCYGSSNTTHPLPTLNDNCHGQRLHCLTISDSFAGIIPQSLRRPKTGMRLQMNASSLEGGSRPASKMGTRKLLASKESAGARPMTR